MKLPNFTLPEGFHKVFSSAAPEKKSQEREAAVASPIATLVSLAFHFFPKVFPPAPMCFSSIYSPIFSGNRI